MATIVEARKFSLFNVDGRNNKFWNITLYDNDDVEVHYGPQGMPGQRKTHSGVGRSFFDKKIKEKTKASHEGGAYTENKVLESVVAEGTSSPQSISKHALAQKAVKDIGASQPELQKLIHYFAEVNAHNLYEASGGKITYDTSSGQFKTTQGVVTLDQIQEARRLLDLIDAFATKNDFDSDKFKAVLNPYLSLIPQKGLVRQMHFQTMFSTTKGLSEQNDILDGLESSYATVIAAAQKSDGKPIKKESEERMFRVRLEVGTKQDFDDIKRMYNETKGSHHDVQSYDVKTVWRLTIEHMTDAFQKRAAEMEKRKPIGANIRRLWHGTKSSNCLSILKAGMIIPPASSTHVCGRAYGNGLYFSDQSTKSIRYATGAWSGGGRIDRKFMFSVNVAMGRMHTPTSGGYSSSYKPPVDYDSCFAKAGVSGVMNNEMIIYRLNQANPVFLCEFTPYGK